MYAKISDCLETTKNDDKKLKFTKHELVSLSQSNLRPEEFDNF